MNIDGAVVAVVIVGLCICAVWALSELLEFFGGRRD